MGEDLRRGVDVVEHGAVDAYAGVFAGIVQIARRYGVGQSVPVPEGVACIAALHGAVKVVPVVEQAQWECRGFFTWNLHGVAQQRVDTVEGTGIIRTADDELMAFAFDAEGLGFHSRGVAELYGASFPQAVKLLTGG
jgi:hypothetical protein